MESLPILGLLLGMLLFGSLVGKDRYRDLSLFYYFSACFFMVLVVRTRGWDFELYRLMFEAVALDNIEASWTEPGFLGVMLLVKSLGGNFFAFNSLFALFFCYFFIRICKWVGYGFCFAALFFFLFHFFRGPYGQLRQTISVLLFLFSLRYLGSRPLPYLLINCFGALFHGVSLTALPLYCVFWIFRWNKSIAWASLLVTAFLIHAFLPYLVGLEVDLLFVNKVRYYLGLSDEKVAIYRALELPRIVFVSAVIFLIYPGFARLSELEKILLASYALGTYLFFIFSSDLRLASRLTAPLLSTDFLILANGLRYTYGVTRFLLVVSSTILGLAYLVGELLMMSASVLKYSW
ncbi:EpsG family protein [Stutzerimonas stutzeri]|uniref:EpsG family protein n=1 Tax=Stutzerimonas stutzeri TaxID=316 RepID=UPI00220BFCBF|nr:EpsG family protein [Stutzerimonas stutzeri]UVO19526.1 EpsG family protein [Stutzerimonas stutzeri]